MAGTREGAIKAWDKRGRKNPVRAAYDWLTGGSAGQGSSGTPGRVDWKSSSGRYYDDKAPGPHGGIADTNDAFTAEIIRDKDGREVGRVYDADRQRDVHDKLHDKYVRDVPRSQQPTIYMLGGGPASGKSSVVRAGLVQLPDKGMACYSNPDDIRDQLPESERLRQTYPDTFAVRTHEEASHISKRILNTALANGQDCVLDTSADNDYENKKRKIEKMRKAGHRVVASYVTLPTEEAYRRSVARAMSKTLDDGSPNPDYGRFCAKEYMANVHASISRDFVKSADLFDEVTLYSGPGYPGLKGGKPKLIASGGRGKPFKVHDQALWEAFMAKQHVKGEDLPNIPTTIAQISRNPRY